MVDGVERGRLNPVEQSSLSFSADEDAEIIEVKTTDSSGDLLLATHLLTSFGKDRNDEAIVASIRLEGGQHLSLRISRRQIEANGERDLLVKLGYRETNPVRAVRLWWQRLNHRRTSEQRSRSLFGGAGIPARVVLVGSVAVICLTGFLVYVSLRSRETVGPQVSSVQPSPLGQASPISDSPRVSANNPPATPSPREAPIAVPKRTDGPDKAAARATPPTSPAGVPVTDDDVSGVTRSGNVVANLRLSDVKKVYIEIRGDAALDQLRNNVVESLGSSGVVVPTTNANEADAALKIVISQNTAGNFEASAMLVNARGTVLWPKVGRARRYSGETTKVLSEISKDLLAEISLARRH